MSEPSPRPWRVEPNARRIFVDANGRYVGSCFVGAASALVVDAVNERDRLRDIVQRLVSSLSVHHSATMAAVMSNREEFDTSDFRKDIDADAALLREARAAIGEGQP